MKIKELMTKDAEALVPEATIEQAAQSMADADVGSLPVLSKGRVVGILTDRDIVVRAVAEGLPPAATKVGEIMTSDIVHCSEDDDVEDAAKIMGEKQVRRLVVLDDDGDFAGVVSLADLAQRAAESSDEVLRNVSRPSVELTQGIYSGGPAPDDRDEHDLGGVLLVQDELAAVEAYKQVLQSIHGGKAGDELRRIENEHEEAAKLLKENIGRLGIDVPRTPGAASAWSGARMNTPELAEDKTSIALLRKGEEREIEDYEKALRDGTLDTGLKDLISDELLPRTRAHADVLRRYLGEGPVV